MPAPATYEQRYHTKYRDKARNALRTDRRALYASSAWQRLRIAILTAEPLCRACHVKLAAEVDHIIDLSQGGAPLDESNLQPLCKPCHSAKTIQSQRKREARYNKG